MITRIVFAACFLLFASGHAFATTYFVDATQGNDTNSGLSRADAWQSVSQVNFGIERNVINTGDSVLFKRGEVYKGDMLSISSLNEESVKKYTRFSSYGSGNKPVITRYNTPASITDVTDAEGVALIVEQSNYIRLSNIEFQGGWSSALVSNASYVVLARLTLGKNSNNGVVISADSNETNEHIVINGNRIVNNFSFDYTYQDSIREDQRTGDGILAYNMKNGRITKNYFENWGHASINLDGYSYGGGLSHNVVARNYLTSPDVAYGGRIVVDDAHHNLIHKNEIVDTSIESQLNGSYNIYKANTFKRTSIPPESIGSDRAAVVIQAYGREHVKFNSYIGNTFVDNEGFGLKVSGNNGRDGSQNYVHDNTFKYNRFIGGGTKEYGVALNIESNEYGGTYSNLYLSNSFLVEGVIDTVRYRGQSMTPWVFNKQTNSNPHDDEMRKNLKIPSE